MPRKVTQDTQSPDSAAQIAELQKQLEAANEAKEAAELKQLEAEQAAEIAKREDKAVVELDPEDKKILDTLAKGKSADVVANTLNVEKEVVIKVAYENMNGESVYQLAERLGVKVNDVYKATEQKDMVRMIQFVDDDGRRRLKELDYEA